MERFQRLGERDTFAPVEQVEVEAIGAKPLQAGVARGNGAAARRMMRQHLADQEHLRTASADGLAHDLFRAAVRVHLGRVDERHPEVEPQAKRGNLRCAPPAIFSHSPRPLAEDHDGLA